MDDAHTTPEQPAAGRWTAPVTALAVGSLAGLVLGFGGIASAQTETPAPSPSTSTSPELPAEQDAARDELCDEDEAAGGDRADRTAESSDNADSAA